jgi:Fur family iron response transcriptional regulator
MKRATLEALMARGIQPSAQRAAIADYVLYTSDHPSADRVWAEVKRSFPLLSRATVYNTLNLFAAKGLLRELVIAEGNIVFDPKLEPHHHFLDDETGEIIDVPWTALDVRRMAALPGLDVREYQVVLRGKRKSKAKA